MNKDINELIAVLLKSTRTKSISIQNAKELFFDCLVIKNVRTATIKYYKNLFYRIDMFFDKYHVSETKDINDSLLHKIIHDCLNENLSAVYINKLIGTCKYFIKLLAQYDYVNDVDFKVQDLKEVEHRINNIELETLEQILKCAESFDSKVELVVKLLLATGVRRTELTLIELKNIDLTELSIILETTKTSTVRSCFFPPELIELFKRYLEEFHPVKYLFEGRTPGMAIAPRSISKILEKIKVRLGIDSLSAHQFRHTFATMIYESSLDIEFVRYLLGHTTFDMTKRYVHNSKKNLKDKYIKNNPFGNNHH